MGRPRAPVLVVERDVAIRGAITALLETMGFQAVGVGDGREAHAFLLGRLPCMIVVDVESGGRELERARQRDARLAAVPVIGLLPGDGDGRADGASLAVVGEVRKPVDFDELERLLESHCPTA